MLRPDRSSRRDRERQDPGGSAGSAASTPPAAPDGPRNPLPRAHPPAALDENTYSFDENTYSFNEMMIDVDGEERYRIAAGNAVRWFRLEA
ncbi:MAG: hypothetical protein ACREQ9_03935 [Candidatus Binatia bacterium]